MNEDQKVGKPVTLSSLRSVGASTRPRNEHTITTDNRPPGAKAGRPPGSRNKMGADLSQMVINAAVRTGFVKIDEHGNRIGTGLDGCEGYFMWAALYEAKTFLALIARIIPYYVNADAVHRVMTREETLAQLKERGLPTELLEQLRKAPAPLDDDEDDDPYGLQKNVTPDGTEK